MSEHLFDAMWDDSPVDVSKEVNFIWKIADELRGTYLPEKYKDVIIPMTIIRRFECALEPNKKKILDMVEKMPALPDEVLKNLSGFPFYNTSKFNLKELLNDPNHIADNFENYLNGFSPNIQEILLSNTKGLDFLQQIKKMDKSNHLYNIIKEFSELDLDPNTIDSIKMGYIFEDLIRRFSENAEAGDHYTPRDAVKLMVNILMAEGSEDIFTEGKILSIMDQACGTGGMLSTAYNFIKHHNESANIKLYGQEINPESYAMCLAEMLIKGQNADDIVCDNTMTNDAFYNTKVRYLCENPPFGQAWGKEPMKSAIEEENKRGKQGRFPVKLPGTGDMQMLFLESAIAKLEDNGRAAIVQNGSPLFSGGTGSGESQIRRWLLENDYLEAIIALPTDLFYNTGIATYIWILSKNKRDERRGKVQLIDAREIYHPLRKSLGNKRNEITVEDRERITKLYSDFEENELSQIYDNEEFIYKEYAVMQPLQRSYAINDERIENLLQSGKLNSFFDSVKFEELKHKEDLTKTDKNNLKKYTNNEETYNEILKRLRENTNETIYNSPDKFMPVLKEVLAGLGLTKANFDNIAKGLSVMDKSADIQKDKKGILYDSDTKDTEIVNIREDINDYMAREVLPYIPDAKAFFEEKLSGKNPAYKTGAEIPFTRYFYKYEEPTPSEELERQFLELEKSVNDRISKLFGDSL